MILLVDHHVKKQEIWISKNLLKISCHKSTQELSGIQEELRKNLIDGRSMENCGDLIHDTYIATGGWQQTTWDWLMGLAPGLDASSTLVDVVNKIWNVAANAVSTIKAGVTEVLNAVKKGLEWISDNVLGPIIDEFVTGFQLILKTIGYLVDSIIDLPELTVTILADGIQMNDYTLRIYRENLDLILDVNSMKMYISGLFIFPTFSFETLSVGLDRAQNLQNWNLLSFVMFLVTHMAAAATKDGKTESWTETNNGGMKFHGTDDVLVRGGESFYRNIPNVLSIESATKVAMGFVLVTLPTLIIYLLNAWDALTSMSQIEGTKFFTSMGLFHLFSAFSFGLSSSFAKHTSKYVELGSLAFRLPGEGATGSASIAILGLLLDIFTFGLGAFVTNFVGFGTPSLISYGIGGIFAATSLIATVKGYRRIGEGIQQGLSQLAMINVFLMIINLVLLGVRQLIP